MIYADTSVLVAALIVERDTEAVLSWLEKQPALTIAVSSWTSVEISSALARKVRLEGLDDASRLDALRCWSAMRDEALVESAITPAHFKEAARIVDRIELKVRPPDALHLAIARGHGFRLATFDNQLAAAAGQLHIQLENIPIG